jgi:N-acetyl-anhydromuramyl-L-alanine amidase AmpD
LKLGLFGRNDCRAFPEFNGDRALPTITRVVIHNGGWSAEQNFETWTCRVGAAHYTIERDGSVYQHMGEEWAAPHAEGPGRNSLAVGVNDDSIGIELNILKNCNSLDWNARLDDVLAACQPTAAQYASLNILLKDIAKRTGVVLDEKHVLGHCELAQGAAAHSDPRAFDWSQIGLSNSKKLDALLEQEDAKVGHACLWYLAYDDKTGSVDTDLSRNGTEPLLRRLRKRRAAKSAP